MPELPEVETVKRQLQKSLIGKRIRAVLVYMDKMVKVGSGRISNVKTGSKKLSQSFALLLQGRKITGLERRAKFLIIKLSGNYFLVIHLRMSGQLIYLRKDTLKDPLALSMAKSALKQTLPSKHTHVEFEFDNGDKLFYNDTRQFGHLRVVDALEFAQVMAKQDLGPEPLTLTLQQFCALVKTHANKRAKDFLLDQSVIAGIGNIYADESLFISRLHPKRKIGSLKEKEIINLHAAIQKVLKRAIKLGGSSIEYFLMTNGSAGKFSNEHLVYGKEGKSCPNCGRPLLAEKIGSRTATFCRHCQK